MSILKVKGNDSGTGTVTLEAPNTNTDQTIAIPDGAGSFVTANASGDVAVSGDLTVDTNTLYVDSTNNRVGVGTASPSATLESLGGELRVAASIASSMFLVNPSTTYSDGIDLQATYNGGGSFGPMKFSTGGSERARIHSSGQLSINTTGNSVSSRTCKITIAQANTTGFGLGIDAIRNDTSGSGGIVTRNNETSGTFDVMSILNSGGTEIGIINANNSAVGFTSTSDYRLKENVVDLTGAIDRVKILQPKRFNFISDPDVTVDGFIAHEVSDAVPEAVAGTKDAMRDEEYEVTPAVLDDDGNVVTEAVMGTRQVPKYQGVDPAKLVPLLTAALQEALAKIETLETEMTSVKARLDALEAV